MIITNPDLTPSLTELINTYRVGKITKAQRKFLQIAYKVNVKQRTSFCLEDFRGSDYNDNLFRQYKYQLKDMIDVEGKSNPAFYKLKGISLSTHDKKITNYYSIYQQCQIRTYIQTTRKK